MLVGVFEVRETPARTMSASSQFSDADAVVMGDGELDRVDAGEIGGVEHVLAAGPALRLLAAHRGSASITGSSTGTAWILRWRHLRSSSRRIVGLTTV